MVTPDDNLDIQRLKAEIEQEKQMRDMLDQSLGELQLTVDELDKRMDHIDDENNEWKTRYETQAELNQQLEKQIITLHDKVDEAKRTLRESRQPKTTPRDPQALDKSEPSPYYLKHLEKEKGALMSQLRDLEWRLDQESKAFHKANEERKQYSLEIGAAKEAINDLKNRQRAALDVAVTPRQSQTLGNVNIAQDQRILDPKKGPIRKTAAVKSLPSLEQV